MQPAIEWDFRIPRVQSINAAGHKYGLVYPGVGWAAWRNQAALPGDLIFDVSDRLRQRGWLVPAYTFPENLEELSVLRIVVRAGMTLDMADTLLEQLREETDELQSLDGPLPRTKRGAAASRCAATGDQVTRRTLGSRQI